jgi:glycosyltransferase involved in cell wall biosynthesis
MNISRTDLFKNRQHPSAVAEFESTSIVIPVVNEVASLKEIVDCLFSEPDSLIREVLIIVCPKTTAESRKACQDLQERYAGRIKILAQKLPFLGGALREGFSAATGSHVVVMYSDGESDPKAVAELVRNAGQNPQAIISASRWLPDSSFEGYPKFKLLMNFLFQKVFSMLYGRHITDFTFGFRIYPSLLVKTIVWQETGHSFVLESILRPLLLHTTILEIPTIWQARSEGKSQLKPSMYFRYLWIGCKLRFSSKS